MLEPRRLARFAVVAGVLAASLSAEVSMAAVEDEAHAAPCPDSSVAFTPETLQAGVDVLTCGLVGEAVGIVRSGLNVKIDIPQPGERTAIYVHGENFLSSATFEVAVGPNGEISYPNYSSGDLTSILGEEMGLLLANNDTPNFDACAVRAHNLLGWKFFSNPTFYLNQANRPSNISAQQAEDSVRAAKNNMADANNDCSPRRPDNVDRNAAYQGTTSIAPNISYNADTQTISCDGNSDSISVVGFGNLPPNVIGVSCPKRNSLNQNELVADDIRISGRAADFTLSPGLASCTTQNDFQSLITHEFGHFFGLQHVSETKYPTMTMSPILQDCTTQERTLGLGDMLGLEALY